MKIDFKKVRKIPKWWKCIPFLQVDMAATVYPYMYFPEDVFNDLHALDPNKHNLSIYIHEKVHLDRQVKHGPFAWNFKYIFSKKFRLEEELEAIRTQMIFLKQNSLGYDIDKKAKQFASSIYLWVLPRAEAKDTLTKLWNSTTN